MATKKKLMIRFEKAMADKVTALAAEHHISVNKLIVDATEAHINMMYTMNEKKDFMSSVLHDIVAKQLNAIFEEEYKK